jgi:alkylation response protein AidB-like acyl-CoA dehydrogenase
MRQAIAEALGAALDGLRGLGLGDAFEPRAAQTIVGAGLHRMCVPPGAGGLGASMVEAAEVLQAIGAVDGSTALGFAMQVHTTGALRDGIAPDEVRALVWRAVVADGALLNNAATEEGGGSPARGAIPGTRAVEVEGGGDDAGAWRLTGEKTWTTWLPNLTHAFVTARLDDAERPRVGRFWVDLRGPGVERREGFEALGMRGSASGRLVLREAPGRLLQERIAGTPDPGGPAALAWFAASVAATYLGVGFGARDEVARWALDRRPGDGSTAVADLPSVRLRLGRLDADLRAARLVLIGAARAWDERRDPSDLGLAKLVATRAAVTATDEALRIAGGPGFLSGPLERAFRDARAGLINPPLDDVAVAGFAARLLDDVSAQGLPSDRRVVP